MKKKSLDFSIQTKETDRFSIPFAAAETLQDKQETFYKGICEYKILSSGRGKLLVFVRLEPNEWLMTTGRFLSEMLYNHGYFAPIFVP